MARVTVEDCIEKIPNRFDLVLTAAQRARGILSGDPLTIDRDNDKNPVVALREIADETISVDDVNDELISSLQRIKRREEEQSAIDEAASLAQDDMAAFNSVFGSDSSDEEGMQISVAPQDDADMAEGGSFSDEGSFAEEGDVTASGEDAD